MKASPGGGDRARSCVGEAWQFRPAGGKASGVDEERGGGSQRPRGLECQAEEAVCVFSQESTKALRVSVSPNTMHNFVYVCAALGTRNVITVSKS